MKRHMKTAYQVLRNRKPNIGYFHVFGCPVYILNNSDQLGKFDAKADEGFFLGYSMIRRAFRVFNRRTLKVEETIHVTFDESNSAINPQPKSETPSVPSIHFGESDPINHNKDSPENASTQSRVEPELKSDVSTSFYPSIKFKPSSELNIGSIVSAQIPISGSTETFQDASTEFQTDETEQTTETESVPSNEIIMEEPQLNTCTDIVPHASQYSRWSIDHPIELVIGDPSASVQTRRASGNECLHVNFLSML